MRMRMRGNRAAAQHASVTRCSAHMFFPCPVPRPPRPRGTRLQTRVAPPTPGRASEPPTPGRVLAPPTPGRARPHGGGGGPIAKLKKVVNCSL